MSHIWLESCLWLESRLEALRRTPQWPRNLDDMMVDTTLLNQMRSPWPRAGNGLSCFCFLLIEASMLWNRHPEHGKLWIKEKKSVTKKQPCGSIS
jgi:hypothetical protein